MCRISVSSGFYQVFIAFFLAYGIILCTSSIFHYCSARRKSVKICRFFIPVICIINFVVTKISPDSISKSSAIYSNLCIFSTCTLDSGFSFLVVFYSCNFIIIYKGYSLKFNNWTARDCCRCSRNCKSINNFTTGTWWFTLRCPYIYCLWKRFLCRGRYRCEPYRCRFWNQKDRS